MFDKMRVKRGGGECDEEKETGVLISSNEEDNEGECVFKESA